WIGAWNGAGGQESPCWAGGTPRARLVRVSKRRAHYADARVHRTRRKEVESTVSFGMGDADMAAYGRSSSPYREVEELSEEDMRDRHGLAGGRPGQKGYWRNSYDVREPFYGDRKPKGPGWERWTSPEDPDRWVWRRKKHRMRTESSQVAPEITTNAEGTMVQGRSGTFAVATHELSHRFEYTV